MSQYVIAIDAMGGDNAPGAIVEGTIQALRDMKDIRVLLAGPEGSGLWVSWGCAPPCCTCTKTVTARALW